MSNYTKILTLIYTNREWVPDLALGCAGVAALAAYLLLDNEFKAICIGVAVFALVRAVVTFVLKHLKKRDESPEARNVRGDRLFAGLSTPEQDLLRHFAAKGTCRLAWREIPELVSGAISLLIHRNFAEYIHTDEVEPAGLEISTEMYDAAVRAGAKDLDEIPF